MFTVLVYVHVKPDSVGAFKAATLDNARNSNKEPGIARFDFIQLQEDPTQFVLIEVYKTPEASGQHKETMHYKKWRSAVESMMAEPRSSAKYDTIFLKE